MAFDGAGNYVRIHNWQQDAANGLNISAPEMDGEDNSIAGALSLCVTRDGQGKMTADFLPNTDNTLNLGSALKRWATLNGVPTPTSQANIGALLYPQTAAEAAASVTPTNFAYPPFNLARYGAKGDGVTNDATAINAGVAVGVANGGATLIYPANVLAASATTFLVGATINDVQSVIHQGQGVDATTVKTNGNFPVFTRAGSATVVVNGGGIRDMTIHGSWAATPANILSYGISCTGSNGAVYENLRIEGCNVGFFAAFNFESFITNVKVLGAGADRNNTGFVFDYTNATNVNNAFYVVNSGAFTCASDGWDIRNGNGSNFVNCAAEACGAFGFAVGFSSTGTINPQFMQFSNCTGDSCTGANWLVQGTVALPAQNMLFNNCWSGLTSSHNWAFLNTINTIFTGNNGISAAQNAIFLNGGCAIDIVGFTGRNFNTGGGGFAGINIANSNGNLVTGCSLSTTFLTGSPQSIAENGTSNLNVVQGNRMPQGGLVLGANSQFRDNQGFVTEASGSVTITAGGTTSVVNHGLSLTPNFGEVQLTNSGNFPSWVTAITGTQFTINIPVQGGSVNIGWMARITRH